MKPNVIIINPDQMRADSMHHLGNGAAYTPNLDKLATEGVSFSNAFCQNPVCVPSRCSFFTGLYPHVHGHRTMAYLLQPREDNLFGDMKKAGYYTISSTRGDLLAGQYPKYHKELIDEYILAPRAKQPPVKAASNRGEPDSDTYYSFLNGILPTENADSTAVGMDDLTVDGAIRSIRKRPKDKPFFMFVGLLNPHPPYQIEQKYYDLIDKSNLPPRYRAIRVQDGKPSMECGLMEAQRISGWSEDRIDELRTVYLAMCAKVDDLLGRMIDVLKEEGIYDDTAILFFSDHGDYTGDYGIVEKAQNCFPDCLTNVPFLIKPPKGIPVDSGVNDQLVELVDVCATVADLSGISLQRQTFSKSLLPTLQSKARSHRAFVTCEGGRLPGELHCSEYNPQRFDPNDLYAPRQLLQSHDTGEHTKAAMIRTKQYKYIRRLQEKDEFYDLEKGEQINRIDDPVYVSIAAALKENLMDWYMETCDIVPQIPDSRFTAEFLLNNMSAAGQPPLVGKILLLYLRLSGKTPSQFIDQIRKKSEG
ncbi:MAG: sulfatase-like hydrolase/transferase [Faecousia sp.]